MPELQRPKVIGIVGSRRRDSDGDFSLAVTAFLACREFYDEVTIVSGGCPKGGDRFAEIIAGQFAVSITIHYPDWSRHGRGAGIVRNTLIAADCDILIALVAADRTGGTEDTVRKATKLGKPVVLVGEKGLV